ncbi:collagen-like triple helix repeat-containing protein [Alteromonas halophila]|uniref:NHL repeat containing protein n=1 Tax=Alteromonas halophila TaxID=516698 RepID=A0A918MWT5_9ALTE|nr:collagen-like protein [Alteromonas halophila]GGW80534.1 hypothetical protein GCM10007391_11840 [Alteromonas halophila]
MKILSSQRKPVMMSAIAASLVLILSGCSGDDGDTGPAGPAGADGADGAPGDEGTPGFAAGRFLIANNGDDNRGTVDLVDQNIAPLNRATTGANEGIALNNAGDLWQAGDAQQGMLRTMCSFTDRTGGMFSDSRDRMIAGSQTGLTNPKGIAVAQQSGMIFAADFNGMRISVFGSQAAGNVAPVAEIMTPVKPWDVAYDENADRLFVALTDGSVAVYDDVMMSDYAPSVMRQIVPADSDGNQLSVNMHGIVYDEDSDRLVLSDVGDAAVADDGQLFVINNASMADGNVEPHRTIGGPDSMLGNPVDIILSGTTLRVAEKSNDAILTFTNIFSGESGDMAPALSVAQSKPESLAEVMEHEPRNDISDTALTSMVVQGVSVSSNPSSDGATTGQIAQFSSVLNSQLHSFDASMSIESTTYDTAGNGYTTFADADSGSGGILVLNRAASNRTGGMYSSSQDRMIMGSNTGLVTPKGLDVASDKGLVFVAEFSADAAAIQVFSRCASGNVMPVLTMTMSGGARPWDVDYDASTDRAYVALTNGTVAVFDEVTRRMQGGESSITGEDRLITPAMAGTAIAAPTNIHGIDYDAQSDALVITDVGSASVADDGKLYVIPGASMAQGLTDMTVSVSGPASMLGNPVDVMLSNGHAYVAEKSNNMVMRFDNILNSAGGDIAPGYSVSYTAPESVAVLPAYFW